ncbi:MAG: twin-arginine translocase TatA/TatE family subunit [Chloroflexi bacterium]|nr:twin-arginine translocase TatA/TatE family subunit [Chloroflexota bacterium]
MRPGPMELIIILVIVMMIFGIGKLPQVGNAIGKSIREFRKGQEEDDVGAEDTEGAQTNTDHKVEG